MTRITITGARQYGSTVYVTVPEGIDDAWNRIGEAIEAAKAITTTERHSEVRLQCIEQLDEAFIHLPSRL